MPLPDPGSGRRDSGGNGRGLGLGLETESRLLDSLGDVRLASGVRWLVLCTLLACETTARGPVTDGPGRDHVVPVAAVDAGTSDDGSVRGEDVARDPSSVPLEAPSPFLEMEVEGHGTAIVSVPRGATSRRPVLVATHGNYDRPEWQCEVWRGIVGDRGFVLCPRGNARPDSPAPDDIRFTYPQNAALEKEIDDDLAALRERFPDHVDPGSMIYAGFSLGAIMGVSILSRGRNAERFPRAVLVEGGHDKWTPAAVKAFASGGGQRVLFACAQPGCASDAKRVATLLDKAGVATRTLYGGKNLGHRYDGPVADGIADVFGWLVEGDARWETR